MCVEGWKSVKRPRNKVERVRIGERGSERERGSGTSALGLVDELEGLGVSKRLKESGKARKWAVGLENGRRVFRNVFGCSKKVARGCERVKINDRRRKYVNRLENECKPKNERFFRKNACCSSKGGRPWLVFAEYVR